MKIDISKERLERRIERYQKNTPVRRQYTLAWIVLGVLGAMSVLCFVIPFIR